MEFATIVTLEAIQHRKHVVLMDAEVDGTIGPMLQGLRPSGAGVVVTNADGDQPGVTMNLYRFVRGIGVRPVLCGNIKGLQDPYRTPATQVGVRGTVGAEPAEWSRRSPMGPRSPSSRRLSPMPRACASQGAECSG